MTVVPNIVDQPEIMYDPRVDSKGHALIGVSPFNGYYNSQNIDVLVAWAAENFKEFHVFTMDGASKYNLMAQGYSEEEAIKKTRKQDKHLYNKIVRALKKIGCPPSDVMSKILLISDLKRNNKYQELYNIYCDFYEKNQDFQEDCLNAAKAILHGKMMTNIDQAAEIAVRYLLEEIPVWFDTPAIMNIQSSVFVYKDLPFYWKKVCCDYNLVSPHQQIYIKDDIS
ncbi:MAG: tRNA-dependent cyclodipeptide synthase [Candidatus Paracaedibacteraceae bacterium]|nr:tRNA-dependent cyclodipeptide synthase [Candidatus Paracaedibacteraceae bacterium]